jgi:hypothetical protein
MIVYVCQRGFVARALVSDTHIRHDVACEAGSYKPNIGTGSCQECPTQSNTIAPASTSLTDCLCNPGHEGRAGTLHSRCLPRVTLVPDSLLHTQI